MYRHTWYYSVVSVDNECACLVALGLVHQPHQVAQHGNLLGGELNSVLNYVFWVLPSSTSMFFFSGGDF